MGLETVFKIGDRIRNKGRLGEVIYFNFNTDGTQHLFVEYDDGSEGEGNANSSSNNKEFINSNPMEEVLDELIRDITKAGFMAKSEARRRIIELLQAQRTQIIEAVEGLKKECPNHDPENKVECYGYDESNNQVLDQVIKEISK